MVQHLALLAGGTGAWVVARAAASTVVAARLVGRAVGMAAALNLSVRTGQHTGRADNQTELAAAGRPVVGHAALLVELAGEAGAGVVTGAGCGVTLGVQRTLGIPLAAARTDNLRLGWRRLGVALAAWPTTHGRPANVALGTLAARLVQDNGAEGVGAAGGAQAARVHAAPVNAGQVNRAVGVGATLANWYKRSSSELWFGY